MKFKLSRLSVIIAAAAVILSLSIPIHAQGQLVEPETPAENVTSKIWAMRGHDTRRTGRSPVAGPKTASKIWQHIAADGVRINMEPTVTTHGVFFGTQGVTRKLGVSKKDWEKSDGRLYGLNPYTGKDLWTPFKPEATPYAYAYPDRPRTARDRPAGSGLHLNLLSGSIEGTAAVDPETGNLYFGRNDGVLYAVKPDTGKLVWKFASFEPTRPGDPEGGGGVIGGPLVTQDGLILFGTFAVPTRPSPTYHYRHQTNAVYAVDRKGKFLWRFPKTGSLDNPVAAPLALSPDGKRVYAVTSLNDHRYPGQLLALDTNSGKLIWEVLLEGLGGQDMAVGAAGTIYIAGMAERSTFGWKPAVFSYKDLNDQAKPFWGPFFIDGNQATSHVAGGIALYENEGTVRDIFISTTNSLVSNSAGGKLFRISPDTGQVTHTWTPFTASFPCVGGLTDISIDEDETVYVGVRGQKAGFKVKETPGVMYALKFGASGFNAIWSKPIKGQLDGASPAIGPDGGLYFGSSDRIGSFKQLNPFRPRQNVADADPVFYGVLDAEDI